MKVARAPTIAQLAVDDDSLYWTVKGLDTRSTNGVDMMPEDIPNTGAVSSTKLPTLAP